MADVTEIPKPAEAKPEPKPEAPKVIYPRCQFCGTEPLIPLYTEFNSRCTDAKGPYVVKIGMIFCAAEGCHRVLEMGVVMDSRQMQPMPDGRIIRPQ